MKKQFIILSMLTALVLFGTEAVFACDRSFDPNTDKFTISAILKMIAPLFVLASTGLIVLNLIVFFHRRRKLILGFFGIILSIVIQYVAIKLVLSFDICLDYFPVLAIVESIVLLLLTLKHVFMSAKNSSAYKMHST